MISVLRGLGTNLVAGVRVALFLPVERQQFRIDAAQLLLVMLFSALVDFAADWARGSPGSMLDWTAVGAELASFALLVAIAALLAWAFSDAPLLWGLPVIVLASLPVVQLVNIAPSIAAAFDAAGAFLADTIYYVILAWFFAVLTRSAYLALAPHRLRLARAVAAGLLLALPLTLPPNVLPNTPWWKEADPSLAIDAGNPAAEPVAALQRELQDVALAAIEDHRAGEAELYFIAFAPDGAGATWRPRLDHARRLMDRHWNTEGRSLVYVNDPSTLTELPTATVTHLREALEAIAGAIDPDEDIVMLYLAGRSHADGSMVASLPPLGLVPLSGAGLSHLFRQAGIRWRVVVVATCRPQAFVDALSDANTLVMASSGCARTGEPAGFADALFGEALAGASSLPAAFEATRRQLAERGSAVSLHVGEAIAAQLAKLKRAGRNSARNNTDSSRGSART